MIFLVPEEELKQNQENRKLIEFGNQKARKDGRSSLSRHPVMLPESGRCDPT
jgi:hypothetical protein